VSFDGRDTIHINLLVERCIESMPHWERYGQVFGRSFSNRSGQENR
jgi:hypothetical protein